MVSVGYHFDLGLNKKCCSNNKSSEHNKSGLIRFFHAVPTDVKVDIELDHRRVFFDLEYKNATKYMRIRPGDRKITIKISGSNDTILWDNFYISPSTPYTVVIQGLLDVKKSKNIDQVTGGTPDTSLKMNIFLDHNNTPDECYSQVRFIHLSPKSPPVDVYTGNYLVFPNVLYGSTAESTIYMQFSTETDHSITIKQSLNAIMKEPQNNQNNQNNMDIDLLGPINIKFKNQYVYTIYTVGIYGSNNTPLEIALVRDWPYIVQDEEKDYEVEQNKYFLNNSKLSSNENYIEEPIESSIRIIHNIGTPIDIYSGDNRRVSNLESNDLMDYIPLTNKRSNRIRLKDSKSKRTYFDDNIPSVKGKRFTLVLLNDPNNDQKKVVRLHEHILSDKPKLYIINLTRDMIKGYKDDTTDKNLIFETSDGSFKTFSLVIYH
jgi:hypothetical protein